MNRLIRLCAGILLIGAITLSACQAQGTAPAPPHPAPRIKVVLYVSPPFVTPTATGFTGLAVELWESVAEKLALEYEYRVIPTVTELLQALMTGEADIAVTNLTITHDRLRHIDFTQPWFDSGLRIMINENRATGFRDLAARLTDAGHVRVYLWIGLAILGATLALTVVDRIYDPDFTRNWPAGMANSFYHVISVVTSGRAPHKELWGAFGRVVAAIWMLVGVAVVAYFTSSITSIMTTNSLRAQINGLADLPGRVVGTLSGTASESHALDLGLTTESFRALDGAVAALVSGRVAAIIGDAPTLEYYDQTHPALPITEVGPLFHPEKYGFGLPIGHPLSRQISQQVVAAHESGSIERLRRKYFGVTQ